MLSLSITFTDEELEELRKAADRTNVPLKTFVHDAVVAAALRVGTLRGALLNEIFEKATALNKRLA